MPEPQTGAPANNWRAIHTMTTTIQTVIEMTDTTAAARYLGSLASDVGRRGMASALRNVARHMGAADLAGVNWAAMRADHVAALIAQLRAVSGAELAPASKALALNALKGAAKAAWRAGTMDTDTYERIRDVKPPKGTRAPAGRDVDAGERANLIRAAAADKSPSGARDVSMLALLMATGIRRAELVGLSMASMTTNGDTLALKLIGKGDKERTVYVTNGALAALRDWLTVRGDAAGPLFCRIDKSGAIFTAHRLTTTAAHKIIQKRARLAGVDDVTPHDFRRTLAGEMLDNGVDIVTVAATLGHADIKTTQRYDRRGERAKMAAASTIHVPYRGR